MSACARTPTCSIRRLARPMSAALCSPGSATSCSTSTRNSTSCRCLRPATNGRTRRISSSTSATACSSRTGKTRRRGGEYKLNRDLTAKGSMRRGEVNSIDSIDVMDPLTVQLNLKAPASQLLAQLTDRAGIMISPKAAEAAGDKFGLHPVCAGPFSFESRVAQDRIVLKRFPGYWDAKIDPLRPGGLSAEPELVGAPGEPAGRHAGHRRVHPADRRAGGAEGSEAEDRDRRFARLHRHHGEHRQRLGAGDRARQERPGAPGVRAGDRSRGADPGRVFGHVYPDGPGQSAQLAVLQRP